MSSVLITGASQGIGRAAALELARRGHRVIGAARNQDSLAGLPVAERLPLDVTDQASIDAAVKAAGEIDVVINNAGETMRAPLESVPVAEVGRLFDLNTLSALRVVQAVLPGMRARGSGHLVFMSSIQGRMVLPIIGPYGMSKWAVEAMAEVLAIETGHFGVKVSVVATVVADTVEQEHPPLRVPAGAPATTILAARKSAPEGEVFFPFDIDW